MKPPTRVELVTFCYHAFIGFRLAIADTISGLFLGKAWQMLYQLSYGGTLLLVR